mmetsp:Transcript_26174/g.86089  ORF Transcript_26174/g.86089 Transcript_26174/m.86089 type:complete len:108 (-) Transcript_26174:163-486(-)
MLLSSLRCNVVVFSCLVLCSSLHLLPRYSFAEISLQGDWVDNEFHGQGKYQWSTGAYYMGAWEKNRMHGQGTFVDDTGREWKGKFFNGQGPGLHTLPKPKQQAVNGS